MVELIYTGLNSRFGIGVVFMTNYFFSGGDIPIDSDALLVTNFLNLNINLIQSFRCAHNNRICVHVFHRVSARTCISMLYCFLKKVDGAAVQPNTRR
jgi:hypothetical protein